MKATNLSASKKGNLTLKKRENQTKNKADKWLEQQ
jgi:hypothetical protein